MAIKTLDEIISNQSVYDINKITFFTITDDGSLVIPDTNLFTTYYRYIKDYIGVYNVTDAQRRYYQYKPDILSLDIYGTPQLYWLILMLNDRECPSKFNLKKTINLIPTTILESLYDTIVTKSNDKLNNNWNQYLTLIT